MHSIIHHNHKTLIINEQNNQLSISLKTSKTLKMNEHEHIFYNTEIPKGQKRIGMKKNSNIFPKITQLRRVNYKFNSIASGSSRRTGREALGALFSLASEESKASTGKTAP